MHRTKSLIRRPRCEAHVTHGPRKYSNSASHTTSATLTLCFSFSPKKASLNFPGCGRTNFLKQTTPRFQALGRTRGLLQPRFPTRIIALERRDHPAPHLPPLILYMQTKTHGFVHDIPTSGETSSFACAKFHLWFTLHAWYIVAQHNPSITSVDVAQQFPRHTYQVSTELSLLSAGNGLLDLARSRSCPVSCRAKT